MQFFRTLILPQDLAELANQVAAAVSPENSGMWQTPLSETGVEPATHYISTGYIDPKLAHLLPLKQYESSLQANEYPGDIAQLLEISLAANLTVTIEDLQTLFNQLDVTTEEPFTALARLNLKLVETSTSI